MKELMVHVERIVRPVRAIAGRKLRMRRELLGHLEAALEEERGGEGGETAALERAKARLGEVDELTRGLQASVPWIEQMLLGRVPLPQAVERLEKRSGWWWKLNYPMTMTQASVMVAGATMLPFLGLMGLVLGLNLNREEAVRLMVARPPAWAILNLGSIAVVVGLTMVCARWIVAVASGSGRLWTGPVAGYVLGIVILPAAAMGLMVGCLNGRVVTAGEVLWSLGVGAMVVVLQWGIGRIVRAMRRPYAEWLMLEV